MTRDHLALLFAILVPLVWVFGTIFGTITHDYTVFQIVMPLVLAEAGWLWGAHIVTRRNTKNDE